MNAPIAQCGNCQHFKAFMPGGRGECFLNPPFPTQSGMVCMRPQVSPREHACSHHKLAPDKPEAELDLKKPEGVAEAKRVMQAAVENGTAKVVVQPNGKAWPPKHKRAETAAK